MSSNFPFSQISQAIGIDPQYPPGYVWPPQIGLAGQSLSTIDTLLTEMRKHFNTCLESEKKSCQNKVAHMEQMLMDLNLSLAAFAVAVATGDIEKVRACLPDLERALEPINKYFRDKIENKMEPKAYQEDAQKAYTQSGVNQDAWLQGNYGQKI